MSQANTSTLNSLLNTLNPRVKEEVESVANRIAVQNSPSRESQLRKYIRLHTLAQTPEIDELIVKTNTEISTAFVAKVESKTDPTKDVRVVGIPAKERNVEAFDEDPVIIDRIIQFGEAIHESLHILYTDTTNRAEIRKQFGLQETDLVKRFYNIAEDGAIEHFGRETFSEEVTERLRVKNVSKLESTTVEDMIRIYDLRNTTPNEYRQNMTAFQAVSSAMFDICKWSKGHTEELLWSTATPEDIEPLQSLTRQELEKQFAEDETVPLWGFKNREERDTFYKALPIIDRLATVPKTLHNATIRNRFIYDHIAQLIEIVDPGQEKKEAPPETVPNQSPEQHHENEYGPAISQPETSNQQSQKQSENQEQAPSEDNQRGQGEESEANEPETSESGQESRQPQPETQGQKQEGGKETVESEAKETEGKEGEQEAEGEKRDSNQPRGHDNSESSSGENASEEESSNADNQHSGNDSGEPTEEESDPDEQSQATLGDFGSEENSQDNQNQPESQIAETKPEGEEGEESQSSKETGKQSNSEPQSGVDDGTSKQPSSSSEPESEQKPEPESEQNNQGGSHEGDNGVESRTEETKQSETQSTQNGSGSPQFPKSDEHEPEVSSELKEKEQRQIQRENRQNRIQARGVKQGLQEMGLDPEKETDGNSNEQEQKNEQGNHSNPGTGTENHTITLGSPNEDQYDPTRFSEAQKLSPILQTQLEHRLTQEAKDEFQSACRTGRPDKKALALSSTYNTRIMEQEHDQGDKEYQIVLVLDRSASMNKKIPGTEYTRIELAEIVVGGFCIALENLGIEVSIIDLYENNLCLSKPFHCPVETAKESIFNGGCLGGTPLHKPIEQATKSLKKSQKQPVIICVTDGEPRPKDDYFSALKSCPFPTVGVSLAFGDTDVESHGRYYHCHEAVTDPNQLRQKLLSLTFQMMF